MEFAESIKEVMASHGLTQVQAAQRCNLKRPTFLRLLNGQWPAPEHLHAICLRLTHDLEEQTRLLAAYIDDVIEASGLDRKQFTVTAAGHQDGNFLAVPWTALKSVEVILRRLPHAPYLKKMLDTIAEGEMQRDARELASIQQAVATERAIQNAAEDENARPSTQGVTHKDYTQRKKRSAG